MNYRGFVGGALIGFTVLMGCGSETELEGTEPSAGASGESTWDDTSSSTGRNSEDPTGTEEASAASDASSEVESGNGQDAVSDDEEVVDGGGQSSSDNFYTTSEILMLGDSLLAWFKEEGASVGDALEASSPFSVTNLSVSGALFLDGEDSIPEQFVEGEWAWVVFDGGGNDANDLCECGQCDEVLGELVDASGSLGRVPAFVRDLTDAGHRVLILGYYNMPASAEYGFDRCNDEADLLNQRYASMAASIEGAYFYDLGQVVSPNDLSHYDEDHVHPSERGTETLGRGIKNFLERLGAW
jgi:lysophospholipase L1-like esterase